MEVCRVRANQSLAEGHYTKARSGFETLLQIQPENTAAHHGVVRTLIESGDDIDKGIAHAEESLKLAPNQPPTLARSTLAKGEAKRGGDGHAAMLRLAADFLWWDQYEKALETFELAFHDVSYWERASTTDLGYYDFMLSKIADINTGNQDNHKSIQLYERALGFDFGDTPFTSNWETRLARILIEQGEDIERGVALAEEAIARVYDDSWPQTVDTFFGPGLHQTGDSR